MQKRKSEMHLDFIKTIIFFIFTFLTVEVNAQRCDANVWQFSKSKNHMVINILGLKLQDTLSFTINNLNVYNCMIVDSDFLKHKSTSDINQENEVTFFVVLKKNKQPKYMYNAECCSDFFSFKRLKNAKKGYTIEFSLNGETQICDLNPSHRWLKIIIGLDENNERGFMIGSRMKFSGLD